MGDQTSFRLAKRIYLPRIIGLGVGFFAVASVFYQTDTPGFIWAWLVFNAFIWPHIAYFWAIRSANPFQGELRNILADAVMCAAWLPLMGFNLVPSATLFIMLCLDCIMVGGPKLLKKGLMGMALSISVVSFLFDVELNLESNLLTIIASLPLLVFHPIFTGGMTFKISEKLASQKRELEIARLQAEEGTRAKTRFLATASHDLRQPMHALGMFTAALTDTIDGTGNLSREKLRHLASMIEASQRSVNDLLDSLLSISKLDAQVVSPNLEPIELSVMMKYLADRYKPEATKKGIEFRMVSSSAIVESDMVLLERILSNLLANAVRYTTQGKILFGCRPRGERLHVFVCDTGLGIPESKQEEIFQEFSQLDSAFSDKQQGLGLGLAIVSRLSDLLGHQISVRSVYGQGSAFSIELPLARQVSLSPSIDKVSLKPTPVKSMTIFAIDDEPDVLEALGIIFDGWGHRMISAVSAEEAKALVETMEQAPDFILSDYRLGGGKTGTELVAELLERWKQSVPVAIITGDTSREPLKAVLDAGIPLLPKPLDPHKLRALIENSRLES